MEFFMTAVSSVVTTGTDPVSSPLDKSVSTNVVNQGATSRYTDLKANPPETAAAKSNWRRYSQQVLAVVVGVVAAAALAYTALAFLCVLGAGLGGIALPGAYTILFIEPGAGVSNLVSMLSIMTFAPITGGGLGFLAKSIWNDSLKY